MTEGGGGMVVQIEKPCVGGIWIFSGTIHSYQKLSLWWVIKLFISAMHNKNSLTWSSSPTA